MKAKAQDALEPYKPVNWNQVPEGLKDADGYWTTIHSGTLGLFVNKDALGGKPVPACWKDLLKPDYKGMVGYLDPSSAAVGYVGAVAVNLALGGSPTNFDPDQFLQGTAQERSDRAQADVLCARRLRRDADPVRLRLQRLSRKIFRKG
jgi:ABC-type Fe3+ transport system substrate-binding protein